MHVFFQVSNVKFAVMFVFVDASAHIFFNINSMKHEKIPEMCETYENKHS